MNAPVCTVHKQANHYSKKVMRSLDLMAVTSSLESKVTNFLFARITFKNVIGFRVLDERDLNEFVESHSILSDRWLYEVHRGGWVELETHRKWFNSPSFFENLKEHFIVDNHCISVMCTNEPFIEDLGADPF